MTEFKDSQNKLQIALQRFTNSKEGLRRIYEGTKTLVCESVKIICSQNDEQETELRNAILRPEEEDILMKTTNGAHSVPSLIVIGQTKAGKSSLINEILGGTFVTQAATPCTARITRLTYSEEPYVKVLSSGGEVLLHHQKLTKKSIPADLLSLKECDRDDPQQVNASVEAGINSEFLKAGVDIIDSPGRNENAALDSLSIKVMDSLIPLIIYVIDGRLLLTQKDVSDIRDIKAKTFGVELFFVVTKLDLDNSATMQMDSYADGTTPEELELTLMRDKMNRVYSRLVKENFLPADVPMEDCPVFHCLSVWKVRQWRRKKNSKKRNLPVSDEQGNHWLEKFDRLRIAIHDFAENIMEENIKNASDTLIRCHSRLCDNFFTKSNELVKHSQEIEEFVGYLANIAEDLHESAIGKLDLRKHQLALDMQELLENQTPRILEQVKSVKYGDIVMESNSIFICRESIMNCAFGTLETAKQDIEDAIDHGEYETQNVIMERTIIAIDKTTKVLKDEDAAAVENIKAMGMLMNEIYLKTNSFNMVDKCRHAIQQAVFSALNTALETFVKCELLYTHEEMMKDFIEKLAKVEETDRKNKISEEGIVEIDASSKFKNFAKLKRVIIDCHSLNKIQRFTFKSMTMALKGVYRTIRNFLFHPLRTLLGKTPVNDASWKQEQASDVLHCIEAENIAMMLYTALRDHFINQKQHINDEIKNALLLLDCGKKMTTKSMEELATYKLQSQKKILECESIYGKYILKDIDISEDCIIGRSEKSTVYKCEYRANGATVQAIMKRFSIRDTNEAFNWLQKYCVYRDLYNAGYVRVYGLSVSPENETQNAKSIDLLMEHHQQNLQDFLKLHALQPPATLGLRLRIGLHVAMALRVLHEHGTTHGGIHLRNIFVGKDGWPAYLSEPSVNFRFNRETTSQPPLELPPEILFQHDAEAEDPSGKKSTDIFGLAMLLWLLYEGTATRAPHHATVIKDGQIVLRNIDAHIQRPEMLHNMPHKLWKLLNEAWAPEPSSRITIADFVEKLRPIVHDDMFTAI